MFTNILSRIKENLISVIFLGVAAVSGLVAAFLYMATGVTAFTPKLDNLVIIAAIAGAVIALASVVFSFKTCKYISFVVFIVAFLEFIRVELDFIANVFVGIDRTSFTPSFIVTLATLILAVVAALVSGITGKELEIKK